MADFYIASRASVPERAALWRYLRDHRGVSILSSWIDEDGEGQTADLNDLWRRVTLEITACDALVLYAEPGDFPLKGALIEAGMALGLRKRVMVCLPGVILDDRSCRPIGSWIRHTLVARNDDVLTCLEARDA